MKILLSKQQTRKIAIVSETHGLIFRPIDDKTSRRSTCAVEFVPKAELNDHGFRRLSSHEIFGFIGLIEIEGLIFIAAITGKSKVAQPIPNKMVNKIYAVDFFCLNNSKWDFMDIDTSGYPILTNDGNFEANSRPSISTRSSKTSLHSSSSRSLNGQDQVPKHPCHELKKLLSNGSFYYSTDFDLTCTLQKRGFTEHSLSFDNFDREFMWNSFLMDEIIKYRDRLDKTTKELLDEQGFLTTVIRGFAETIFSYVNRLKVGLTIISRQSWKRAGTRFNARGIDDEGHVANFVETEMIMYSSQYCYAFTQIRGSIPVFWEQDTSLISPKIQITRSIEATQPIFDEHFMRLFKKYGPVHIINLLSTKSSELQLSRRYKEHLKNSGKMEIGRDVFLTDFDFHRETSQDGFAAASKIIPKIRDTILAAGYFSYDVKEGRLISEQDGVFRTNCLDCLDRTNLVQQIISSIVFKLFLEDFRLIEPKSFIDDSEFVQKENMLWANHGDQISQIYTGTNALKSSYSRKGKMSFSGALSDATKSVSRMYINNFVDKGKQQNIDTLLGRLPHQQVVELYDPICEYINERLPELEEEYTTHSNINLLVGSFNVNGNSRRADLSEWLFPIGDKFKPDVVVLGLQEVIELTAGSILNADYTKSSFWENMVTDCLNQYEEKYLLLRAEQMSSLLILFFVRSDKANNVKQVGGSTKKTGFGGITGNKGAVAIRFDYGATSFCFVNTHLSAGVSNIDERRHDYNNIYRNITFPRSKTIPHHDSLFWLGDLNYRITLMNDEVRRELRAQKDGYINRLLEHDQLTQEINEGVVFQGFKEPTVQFRPTYKYDYGTDNYDTSDKARTPSWTDRIIYKGENLHPLAYSDAPMKISDHKPVYAAYRANVKFINEEKKINLVEKLYTEYKKTHPEGLLKDFEDPSYPESKDQKNGIILDATVQSAGIKLIDLDDVSSCVTPPLPVLHSPTSIVGCEGSSTHVSNKVNELPPPPPASRHATQTSPNLLMSLNEFPVTSVSPHKAGVALAALERQAVPNPLPPPPIPSRSTSSLKNTAPKVDPAEVLEIKRPLIPPLTPSRRKSSTALNKTIPSTESSHVSPSLTPKIAIVSPKASIETEKPPVVKKPEYLTAAAAATKFNSSQEQCIKVISPNSESDEELSSKKKPIPKVPVKKPELEKLSVDSWKPLKPN
ncbi:inp52p [Saccharomyces arboricola H-6]|uniref:phosphoinositide 5-phosphatase n=1 Tax=Saccharomyces arboricola (strain H-6 / AS 2.3317 / CBS 10644) TaxID=1160507 RepID=J8Q038_SACAR|nr:inp52p [Saccharomyces arboricola H-6]